MIELHVSQSRWNVNNAVLFLNCVVSLPFNAAWWNSAVYATHGNKEHVSSYTVLGEGSL